MWVVHSKFRNYTTTILCSVLNSRLLKSTILKFSFMLIEFQYNLSIHVEKKIVKIKKMLSLSIFYRINHSFIIHLLKHKN